MQGHLLLRASPLLVLAAACCLATQARADALNGDLVQSTMTVCADPDGSVPDKYKVNTTYLHCWSGVYAPDPSLYATIGIVNLSSTDAVQIVLADKGLNTLGAMTINPGISPSSPTTPRRAATTSSRWTFPPAGRGV
jgi:hypothetical protein